LPAAIALCALCGWAFRIPVLTTALPGLPAMNPAVAACFITATLSVIFYATAGGSRKRKVLAWVLAAILVLIGATKLSYLASGTRMAPVDHLLTAVAAPTGPAPREIPLRTAINLLLSGMAILLLDVRTRRGFRPTELLTGLCAIIGFLALIGYSYGLIAVYRTASYEPMSLPTAVAFVLLAGATLLARTDAGVTRIIMSDTVAGLLARLTLPLVFLLPVLLGALRIAGENAGWYTTRVGVALFATSFILFFLLAVWWTVRLLLRSEAKRHAAEERVRQLNADLERRVADRTAELNLLNQELRNASKAKDEFLAVLSHELRAPLTPALAAAGYLADHRDLPDELRRDVETIRTHVRLEARLIDDLLDITRITRGKVDLELEAVDAHDLVRKAVAVVDKRAQELQLSLQLDLRATDHHVTADAVRLQQVLWNLLNNAVKFSAHRGRIVVRSWDEDGRFALEIQDEGIGIEPELQQRIFQPFEQGEGAAQRRFGGLGLGLAISKTLLDLQGGTISVQSDGANRGSRFHVTLPVSAPPQATQPPVAAPSVAISGGLDLLVVDDHQETLQLLSRLLRTRGHRVSTAESVLGALDLLQTTRFDAVISDIGLPDGSGCDVMEAARDRHGLRGIAVSGFGTQSDILRSREAGFEQHLIKPFEFSELEAWLSRVSPA
jgi:signal transduction histidine kinase/CheY-like chemotaxis protein